MNTTTPPPTQPTVQDVNPTNLQIEIGENVVALLKCPVPVAELAGMIDHLQTAYGPDLRFMEKPKGYLVICAPAGLSSHATARQRCIAFLKTKGVLP